MTAATLRVVHTPGHTADHICLQLIEEGALFSADCVLGAGTAVFEDLATYMASLRRLLAVAKGCGTAAAQQGRGTALPLVEEHGSNGGGGGSGGSEMNRAMTVAAEVRIYPGHGPVIEDGCARIDAYIEHRNKRERQILETMRAGVSGDGGGDDTEAVPAAGAGSGARAWTAMQLVEIIYRESTPRFLWPAAAGNVAHHMSKLAKEGVVVRAATQDGEVAWVLVAAADGARL